MSLVSRIVGRGLGLPPALVARVAARRGLRVPMADGVELPADLYLPVGVPNAPTVLIRSPYGRGTWVEHVLARPMAERGFQVVVQSCRGTAGAAGVFDPFANEGRDGIATLDWVEKQEWFNGNLLTFGPSYLGYVQWAMAPEAGERITAMATMVTASQFRDLTYAGDAFTLRGCLSWSALVVGQERGVLRAQIKDFLQRGRVRAAFPTLPLRDADIRAVGRRVEWFQEWLLHSEPDDPYWASERDHRARAGQVTAPVSMVAGWHDIVLEGQLADYRALRAAGRRPYLTVGPWTHAEPGVFGAAMREALVWFRAHVTGDFTELREQPVRLFVQGAGEWRDYPDWPPPGGAERSWYLRSDGGLSTEPPTGEETPDRYRYDPADPTPGVGGPLLGPGGGPRDNAELEARPDVLVYTSGALAEPVEAIGPVRARIGLRSSREHTDLFVRLCDVDRRGRSTNVCDGLRRLTPTRFPADEQGVRTVEVELAPTAYRFRAGHRIRVQVSSGAFPRFARNLGTGEPLATAVRMVAADQEIFHDPGHPSGITLTLAPS
jgi:putative CocE/NonD family hydrolase